jgi:hypothetical protein
MKIYQATITMIMLFQSLSCSDVPTSPRPKPKKYCVKTEDVIIFSTPISKDLVEYFPNSSKKLSLPQQSRDKIVAMCTITDKKAAKKETTPIIELQKNNALTQEVTSLIQIKNELETTKSTIQEEMKRKEKELQEIKKKIIEEQRIQKQIAAARKEQAKVQQEQNNSDKKNHVPLTPEMLLTSKQRLAKLKFLMNQNGVSQLQFLCAVLKQQFCDICNGSIANNKKIGPCVSKAPGTLYGSIDEKSSYVFSACTHKILIIGKPYCAESDISSLIGNNFICTKCMHCYSDSSESKSSDTTEYETAKDLDKILGISLKK